MKYTELEDKFLSGSPIRRTGWDKGVFIFRQVPANIPAEIIPKMQSLPDQVKQVFIDRKVNNISYDNQAAMVMNNNEICSWSASVEDLFANNWELL